MSKQPTQTIRETKKIAPPIVLIKLNTNPAVLIPPVNPSFLAEPERINL